MRASAAALADTSLASAHASPQAISDRAGPSPGGRGRARAHRHAPRAVTGLGERSGGCGPRPRCRSARVDLAEAGNALAQEPYCGIKVPGREPRMTLDQGEDPPHRLLVMLQAPPAGASRKVDRALTSEPSHRAAAWTASSSPCYQGHAGAVGCRPIQRSGRQGDGLVHMAVDGLAQREGDRRPGRRSLACRGIPEHGRCDGPASAWLYQTTPGTLPPDSSGSSRRLAAAARMWPARAAILPLRSGRGPRTALLTGCSQPQLARTPLARRCRSPPVRRSTPHTDSSSTGTGRAAAGPAVRRPVLRLAGPAGRPARRKTATLPAAPP